MLVSLPLISLSEGLGMEEDQEQPYRAVLRELTLKEEEKRRILHDNAVSLLDLEPYGSEGQHQ